MDEACADSYSQWINRNALIVKYTMKIDFYKHSLDASDKTKVQEVLNSLFLTTGEITGQFEKKFADLVGSKFAVGLSSCTMALELALRYFNIGPGDEVITTPLSFIATANVIETVGAKPIFVDVEPATGNIDATKIASMINNRTKAIIAVHLYGQMCDMVELRKIADKNNLKIIEDSAHCIEGARDGVRVGQLGDVACYSFYATKNLTCGEGGAITCNDSTMSEWFIKARQHGMNKGASDRYSKRYEHYDMEFLGCKCNMSNIQAALLVNQIDRLSALLNEREKIAQRYNQGFSGNEFINMPTVLNNSVHARHLYTILVNSEKRDIYMCALQDAGIGVAVNFRPIHLMKYYREKYNYKPGTFTIAENIGSRTITLPFYPKLTNEEIDYVIDEVNKIVIL